MHLKFDGVPRVDSILDDSWLPKLHIKGNMTTLNEVGLMLKGITAGNVEKLISLDIGVCGNESISTTNKTEL